MFSFKMLNIGIEEEKENYCVDALVSEEVEYEKKTIQFH